MDDESSKEEGVVLGFVLGLVIVIVLAVLGGVVALTQMGGASTPAAPAAATSAPKVENKASLGNVAMTFAGGALTLSGQVPDEKSKGRLLKPARLLFGDANVTDKIEVVPSAPGFWWNAKPIDVMARLRGLAGFDLTLDGKSIKLAGEVATPEQKTALESALPGMLVTGAPFASDLKVVVGSKSQLAAAGVLLNEAIEFASGSATLPEANKARLLAISELLKEENLKVRILGHTDNTGAADANKTLSQARAESVKAFLAGNGVAAANLDAAGVGSERPIADNGTAEGRSRNRRIEFTQQ
jgi:OmpA-OmpF porin, OOP family